MSADASKPRPQPFTRGSARIHSTTASLARRSAGSPSNRRKTREIVGAGSPGIISAIALASTLAAAANTPA